MQKTEADKQARANSRYNLGSGSQISLYGGGGYDLSGTGANGGLFGDSVGGPSVFTGESYEVAGDGTGLGLRDGSGITTYALGERPDIGAPTPIAAADTPEQRAFDADRAVYAARFGSSMGGFERNLTLAAGGLVGAGEVLFDAFVKAPVLGLGAVFGSAPDQTYGRLTESDYFSMHTENLGNFIGGTASFLGQDHPLDSVFAGVENRLSQGQALSDSDPFAAGRIFGGLGGEAALLGTGVGSLARGIYNLGRAGVGIYQDVNALSSGLAIDLRVLESGGRKALTYRPTSGVLLQAQEGRTTTILGSFNNDMQSIVGELGNVKSTDFGPRVGGFNVLNAPDNLFVTPRQFGQTTTNRFCLTLFRAVIIS